MKKLKKDNVTVKLLRPSQQNIEYETYINKYKGNVKEDNRLIKKYLYSFIYPT